MFNKDNPIFANVIKPLVATLEGFLGTTYETQADFAVLWFNNMTDAQHVRSSVNAAAEWPVCSKPQTSSKNDDTNPFTCDVVGITMLPRDLAMRYEKYGGDAYAGGLMELIELGVEIH